MNLDCNVVIGGVDYTSHVIGIERRATLCEQDHVVTVTLDCNGSSIVPYDEITIKELGTTVFTGYVEDITVYVPEYNAAVTCRTARKKLEDYWLDEEHVPDGASTVADEIAWAMTQAGVSYETESNVGSMPVPSDRTWRYVSTWDMIEDLLRTGGLQIWDAADGVLHIGRVYNALNPSFSLDDFLSINRDESDDYTRNGIAVYGSGVMSFDTRTIDWLGTRKRYGAFAIPEVRSVATAQDLVSIALDEFGSKADVITCEVEGNPSYRVSQVATLTEGFCNLSGEYPLTSLESTMRPDSGYKMRLTFGERCPVLWGRDSAGDQNGVDYWPGPDLPYSSELWYSESQPSCAVTGSGITYASWRVSIPAEARVRVFKLIGRTATELYHHTQDSIKSFVRLSPSGRIFCAIEEGSPPGVTLRYSDDESTWNTIPVATRRWLKDFYVVNDDILLVSTRDYDSPHFTIMYVSTNGGASFTEYIITDTLVDMYPIAGNTTYWYRLVLDSTNFYLYRRSYGGAESATTIVEGYNTEPYAYDSLCGDICVSGNSVYVVYNASRGWEGQYKLRCWRSDDQGASMAIDTEMSQPPVDPYTPRASVYNNRIAAAFVHPPQIYVQNSWDYGASWGELIALADNNDVRSELGEFDISVYGGRCVCWKTTDGSDYRVSFDRG